MLGNTEVGGAHFSCRFAGYNIQKNMGSSTYFFNIGELGSATSPIVEMFSQHLISPVRVQFGNLCRFSTLKQPLASQLRDLQKNGEITIDVPTLTIECYDPVLFSNINRRILPRYNVFQDALPILSEFTFPDCFFQQKLSK